MKLKKLTLQAFGPFKDRVVINFEERNIDKGLLLISGDTGAGKTTIFDAVCYALYGKTSGSRTANSLRSDWADPDTETFVELKFYYKNKEYEVRRTPEYFRKKKTGEGEVKQTPTAEININGRVFTKLSDVNEEIEKLIGLDYNQFRQVAMLSQGEFTKFLLATSEEKTTIFRKIFGTDIYYKLQDKLKYNMIAKKDEIEKVKDKIDTEKSNIESIINVYGLNNEETLETLYNKINEEGKVVLQIKSERDKKSDEKTKLSSKIDNLSKLNKDIITYQKAKEDLDDLLLSNPYIKKDKENYEYNIKIASQLTNIIELLDKDNKTLETKKEKLLINKKELDLKQIELKEKETSFKLLDSYNTDLDKLNIEINELINKNKSYEEYLIKIEELNKIETDYKEISNNYDKQNSIYEKMRKEYYLNISVEIAESLVDGEECPVCGSINHPHIRTSKVTDFTKEDLNNNENILKRLDSQRKTLEAKIEHLRKLIKEFNIPNDINVELEKEKNNTLLLEKKNNKEKLDNDFKILSNLKQSLISNIKSLEDNIKIFKEDINSLEINIKEYNIKLNDIYKDNNTSYDDYISKVLNRNQLIDLKNKIDLYDNKKKEFESTIKLLEPEVKDKTVVDLSLLQDKLKLLIEEYNDLDNKYTTLNSLLEKLKSSTKNIETYIKDSKEVQTDFNIIKVLSDTANASLNGVQKITFENYVQAYFMKSVLIEANKRLIKMTDSRYELKKKETEVKLNVKTGLDFAIFDSYTGKERDVASLSGGEKFKASLALALGLSDAISNNRGGIKIDSLFIDEGFGSLDSDSLNQALNILSDLSGNDKLVGVISHVSELMSRIDNKIFVKKTNTGSVVNIESNN